MAISHRVKIFLLVLGDLAALYVTLFLTLYLRYRSAWREELIAHHLNPFTLIFILWIGVFYAAGLYDLRRLRNNLEFVKIFGLTLAVNAGLAIAFFYLVPVFGITPKTNLFLFLGIFALIGFFWRRFFNRATALATPLAHITLIGESDAMRELHEYLRNNPQFGFTVRDWIKNDRIAGGRIAENGGGAARMKSEIREGPTEILVVPREMKHNKNFAKMFYELFADGIAVYDLPSFYEEVFRKVPIAEITEEWFLEHIAGHHRFYDGLKRAFEVVFSIILFAALSPILLLAGLLVKLTSQGPVIYRQVRTGKNGAPFTLYKFRSMRALAPDGSAEKTGAQWAPSATRDPRATPIGHFLRITHLDELPQLANIIRGDISFVGPRPERPEFVEKLRGRVPFYEARLIVKPGVTGWAQLHHRSDQTAADVEEKLKYDIYYIKNRSLVIDVAIIIKTLKTLFATPR